MVPCDFFLDFFFGVVCLRHTDRLSFGVMYFVLAAPVSFSPPVSGDRSVSGTWES